MAISHLTRGGAATLYRTCPECGADVQVLGGRWLALHRDERPMYSRLLLGASRCPGSLLLVSRRPR
ncbi:MAG: hypothetical protein M3211_12565 [Actinomycetota bacterium]|nr:hypothetical protein [Actinomycetota bacterium]